MWIIPAKVAGIWKMDNGELNIAGVDVLGTMKTDKSTINITEGSTKMSSFLLDRGIKNIPAV